MAFQPNGSMNRRSNPFARTGSPSPGPTGPAAGRPKSAMFSSSSPLTSGPDSAKHNRTHSNSTPFGNPALPQNGAMRHYRQESRNSTPTSGTFAPAFIKTEEMQRSNFEAVRSIEGENDFSGKRYVWLKDPQHAFVKGWVIEELQGGRILVQCDDGTVSYSRNNDERSTNHFSATRG